ncbi:MAG: toll/interleukin-1 receptor domain-containing protein, partial [Pseudomonadota bacterium]
MGDNFSNVSGGRGGVNIATHGSSIEANPRGDAKGARVFLCHVSADKAFATLLRSQLAAAGHEAWLDVDDLKGGDEWRGVIAEAIAKADVLAILVSRQLLGS